MKKPNRIERKSSGKTRRQQPPDLRETPASLVLEHSARILAERRVKSRNGDISPARADIMISRRRGDVLAELAVELRTTPKEIGENAISSYLDFIEKFPAMAEAQPRFVRGEVVFAVLSAGPLYERLDRVCAIYNLDRNSVADSAIGAYLDLVLMRDDSASREFWLSCRGSSDPENIAFILSQAGENVRSTFAKLVREISVRPFAQACEDFGALRELMMHHPGFRDERQALEMIVEGASRIGA